MWLELQSWDVYMANSPTIESQNSWGWKGPLEVTWFNPWLKQGHLEQDAQDHVQVAFDGLRGWLHLFGQLVPVHSHGHHTVHKCFQMLA